MLVSHNHWVFSLGDATPSSDIRHLHSPLYTPTHVIQILFKKDIVVWYVASELEASLVYIASSRPTRATCLKKEKNQNRRERIRKKILAFRRMASWRSS